MQNDVEVLIKLIIPAILLIFWALSNLFNRDNAANPAQARDRTSPLGPRPGMPQRPPDRLSGSPATAPPRPGQLAQNEEIMIIRAEPNRPQGRPGPQPRRNQGRSRQGQNSQNRRQAEFTAPKSREQVGGRLVTDVNQALTTTLDLRPLTQSMAAASASTSIGSQMVASSVAEGVQPSMSALDLRLALTDPAMIRQAFLLNELLQPPVAHRARRASKI